MAPDRIGKPNRRSVAVVGDTKYFENYKQECGEWLSHGGWDVTLRENTAHVGDFDVVLVIGIHLHTRPSFRSGQVWIGIQTEQLEVDQGTDWQLKRNRRRFRGVRHYYDLLVDWSPNLYLSYSNRDQVRHIPHGCRLGDLKCHAPEFDLVFVGNPTGSNSRRSRLLAELQRRYRMYPEHFLWGDQRDEVIRRSAVCLNIHFYETRSFEAPRMFEMLAGGVFVISEVIENSFPFVAGRDYVSFENESQLFAVLDKYLKEPGARTAIAEAGRETAGRYSFADSFGAISLEMSRCLVHRRAVPLRWLSWAQGRLDAGSMEAVDELARMRRRFMAALRSE